jgi:hypothetical protein
MLLYPVHSVFELGLGWMAELAAPQIANKIEIEETQPIHSEEQLIL